MDDADISAERTEREQQALIALTRAGAAQSASYERCRECNDDLPLVRRAGGFCSTSCRDDFQYRQTTLARQGRLAVSR